MDELGYKNTVVDKYLRARKIHNIDVYRLMGNFNVLVISGLRPRSSVPLVLLVPSCGFPLFLCLCLQHAKVQTRTILPHYS
jgi:hypothetical protein